ncbi:MFS transporter [Pseudomonas sp. TH21]|jgi:MFS family permease|nr:MFS transporter [Pseudomonas fluorescens]MBK5477106.1 MFS transporter [Pseudomonas sp. TH21]QTV17182.1 MFS transporter [Pseudomonas fluorescens]
MLSSKRDNSLVTPRIKKARMATFAGFMIMGALFYTWSVGVSAFRNHLGMEGSLGDLNFGMVALGIAIGGTFGAFIVGYFVDRFGPRTVIRTTLLAYPLSLIALGFASQYTFALMFGCLLGALRGSVDTALNAHGVQVERFYQRSIMSAFHAYFSLGGFLFGILASYLAGFSSDSAIIPFTVAGVSLALLSLLTSQFMLGKDELLPVNHEPTRSAAAPTARNWKVLMLMVAFGALLIAGMISESSVSDWGQEFLVRETGMTISTAGLAISFFTGAGFIARMTGDWLAERIGAAAMVFCCGAISIVGIFLATLSHAPVMGMAGFALLGLGLACIAPLMLSAAGRKDPANSGRNVGIVNGIGFGGMLGGPAVYSYLVSTYGIGALFYMPLVLMSLIAIFGPLLMRVKPGASAAHPAASAAANNSEAKI